MILSISAKSVTKYSAILLKFTPKKRRIGQILPLFLLQIPTLET
jgi:hypothetical protein